MPPRRTGASAHRCRAVADRASTANIRRYARIATSSSRNVRHSPSSSPSGIVGSGVSGGRLVGGPCPAASAGIAVTGVPAATPGYVHGTLPGRRVARLVARRAGNPSAASAVSAIPRVIGAASALSARERGYGKEEVYIRFRTGLQVCKPSGSDTGPLAGMDPCHQ